MELREKVDLIYRFIRLSMPLYSAEILAECTQEEIDILEKDKEFQRTVEWHRHNETKRLLETMDRVIDSNTSKGVSTELRWKLAHLDPTSYGDASAKLALSAKDGNKKFNLTFEISSELDNDNIEEFVPDDTNNEGQTP